MTKQNKAIIAQTLLLLGFLMSTWVIGYWYDYYEFAGYWFFGLLFMIILDPIMALIYYRQLRKIQIGRLNKVFRAGLWLMIFLVSIMLALYIYDEFWTVSYEFNLSLLQQLKYNILYYFSPSYIFDPYGLKSDIQAMLNALPYLALIAYFYLIIRINRNSESV